MNETESILASVKKMLGISAEYEQFDADLIMHINSVFVILTQLGVGPSDGFTISDEFALWSDFLPDSKLFQSVKTYVYQKVKLIFDPPLTSSVVEAMNRSISEFEWRLNVAAENASSST